MGSTHFLKIFWKKVEIRLENGKKEKRAETTQDHLGAAQGLVGAAQDPIWPNIVLFLLIFVYGNYLMPKADFEVRIQKRWKTNSWFFYYINTYKTFFN